MFRGRRRLLALLCSMGAGLAYADGHAIDGTVNDVLGRPLAGATVTLKALDGSTAASTQTDAQGHFHFASLPPNRYQLDASKTAFKAGATTVSLPADADASTSLALASEGALRVAIKRRVQKARNAVSASTGGSSYRLSQQDIQNLPQGAGNAFNQVLLQTPGVAQDSYGQLHVRGDHGDLQYRINGIILPESIEGFGQTLDPQIIQSTTLLTGALPAQYGYRTAGVVDIQTKTGAFADGGSIGLEAGSYNTRRLDGSASGSKDGFNYFVSGSLLGNDIGIENPTASHDPEHDRTEQAKGFGYFSWALNDSQHLSLILGSSSSRFQIPDVPGQSPAFAISGNSTIPASDQINEQQKEQTQFGILSLQGTRGDTDYQLALFSRYSLVQFEPDVSGDLAYIGQSTAIRRSGWENGLQADASYHLNPAHTLRTGVFLSAEALHDHDQLMAFPLDNAGDPLTTPASLPANDSSKTAWLEGVYVQDEWKAAEKLTVNYGARFDHVDAYVTASQLSPRLGAVYQLSPATTLHAGYARYFTPPPNELVPGSTVQAAQNTTAATPTTGNDPVKPESSNSYDAGISHEFTPAFTMGLDSYYKDVKNLLDEGQFGTSLLLTPFNYAEGKVYGLELTSNYHQEDFSAYLNLARSTALGKDIVSSQYNFDSDELAYISSHFILLDHDQTLSGSGGVSWQHHDSSYSADFLAGSGLRRDFANTRHLPGYAVVNLAVSHSYLLDRLGKLEGKLSVVNLLDRIYEIRDGSGVGVGAPQYGQRRGFYVGLSKKF
jgi:outer membrane receptor protein involved in Fe transport